MKVLNLNDKRKRKQSPLPSPQVVAPRSESNEWARAVEAINHLAAIVDIQQDEIDQLRESLSMAVRVMDRAGLLKSEETS